jgi:hypothetical protein
MSSLNVKNEQQTTRSGALGTVVKFSKDSAIGALAAVVAKTLVAPIERVKLILQVGFLAISFWL